jgi:hypothetical protein
MDPDAIDRVLRKHATALGMGRGIRRIRCARPLSLPRWRTVQHATTCQRAAGHVEPGSTKLYDRRGYNPEKSASFFATY